MHLNQCQRRPGGGYVAAATASLVTAQQEVAANPAPTVPSGVQTMPTQ
ncbi:hypothetical protein [Streptacidiphilus albus]|nr:hypothetical protein [Streptacidiphilus albus]